MPKSIKPFAFPTTTAFVDDSTLFLNSIKMSLNPELAFRMFHSPVDALFALNSPSFSPSHFDSFLSLYQHRSEVNDAHHVIDINLDKIHREVQNEQRFELISVVVVDYDMPEINGLEFCRMIKNPSIKKILLTGKADEQIAVQAFNEHIIDLFIPKSTPDVLGKLNRAIAAFQDDYLLDIESLLAKVLTIGSRDFLHHPAFVKRFEDIRRELGIVEHYLTCQPDGILMLDRTGIPYLLVVATEDALQAHYEIADDLNAPTELLRALRSGRHIPHFWKNTKGNYTPVYTPWKDYLLPAEEVACSDASFLYSIVKNPRSFNLKYIESYNNYLDRLDEEQREHHN